MEEGRATTHEDNVVLEVEVDRLPEPRVFRLVRVPLEVGWQDVEPLLKLMLERGNDLGRRPAASGALCVVLLSRAR